MTLRADAIGDIVCELGESPLWLPEEGRLAWLDIHGRHLHRHDPRAAGVTTTALEARVTALGLGAHDELIAAIESGLGWVDPQTGRVRPCTPALVHDAGARMNDGAVAPDGSFWAGSMAAAQRPRTGGLWRYTEADGPELQLGEVTISNGLDWLPDDPATMLYADSAAGGVDVLELDDRGRVGSRRRLIDVDPLDGVPDGLSVDAAGVAWVAIWGAGEVRAYDRNGALLDIVLLPARHASSCAFGGEDGRTLYITSAREDLAAPGPMDGRLFACAAPHAGQPPRRFGG